MYKVRVGNDKTLFTFSSRQEVFDWVKRTQRRNTIFSLLCYEHNSLETMDRYFYDGRRFVIENILS